MADPTRARRRDRRGGALDRVGLPEAALNLAQAAVHLALAPKSNATPRAVGRAADVETAPRRRCRRACAARTTRAPRRSGTASATSILTMTRVAGSTSRYLPAELAGRRYFEPSEHGAEAEIAAPRDTPRRRGRRSPDGRRAGQEKRTGEAVRPRTSCGQASPASSSSAAHAVSLGGPDAHDPSRDVHDRRHGAVQAVLHGRGAAAGRPGDDHPAVLPGKLDDIDIIGHDPRHGSCSRCSATSASATTSRSEAIPYAWELVTEVLGLEPGRLWVTVHETTTTRPASGAARSALPAERIQQMGEDNFWKMGDTGPCGPCSRDLLRPRRALRAGWRPGRAGTPSATPRSGTSSSCSSSATPTGRSTELPKKNIDTGAGFERILTLLQGVGSLFETDLLAPVVDAAASLTGIPRRPGRDDRRRAAHPRRPREGDDVPRLGRRLPLERGARLRAAARPAPRRAARPPARCGGDRAPGPHRRRRRHDGPRLPEARPGRLARRTVVGHEEEAFRRTLRAGHASSSPS